MELFTVMRRQEMIVAPGQPVTQGSKRGFAVRRKTGGEWEYTGKVAMPDDPEKLTDWRAMIAIRCRDALAGRPPFTGAVGLRVVFSFTRPKAHYGTGRNAAIVKPNAAPYPVAKGKNDGDKLQRAVMDALTVGGMWGDDAQVAFWLGAKIWCLPGATDPLPADNVDLAYPWTDVLPAPGCVIRVWELEPSL